MPGAAASEGQGSRCSKYEPTLGIRWHPRAQRGLAARPRTPCRPLSVQISETAPGGEEGGHLTDVCHSPRNSAQHQASFNDSQPDTAAGSVKRVGRFKPGLGLCTQRVPAVGTILSASAPNAIPLVLGSHSSHPCSWLGRYRQRKRFHLQPCCPRSSLRPFRSYDCAIRGPDLSSKTPVAQRECHAKWKQERIAPHARIYALAMARRGPQLRRASRAEHISPPSNFPCRDSAFA